ncbi:MAG: Tad domain-containing protein [Candidatus Obscuribacterales bacterium]
MSKRNKKGNILLMVFVCICFVVAPTLMFLCECCLQIVARSRAQSIVEAAALVAANDLSKIIVDDPHFGLVSLSNYPPIGKGTCAPDGEPLPVTGINTLVGTVRQNAIVAQELQNAQMNFLVDRDKEALDQSIEELNANLSECLKSTAGNSRTRNKWLDLQANAITPADDVEAFLRKNLPENVQIESIKLTNGWLEGEGDTTVNVPQPASLAQVPANAVRNGTYRAFVNVPAARRNFNFAGVGEKSSLVSSSAFRAADKKHICSIVRLECVLKLESLGKIKIPLYDASMNRAYCVAACQPFAMPDSGPKGAMTLRFTGGPVAALRSWSDFLRDGTFRDNKVTTYDAVGGDYPLDPEARMQQSSPLVVPTTSNQFAEHFYYWLRNGHTKPRIDAIIEMVNAQFQSGPNEIYAYEFSNDGGISRRIISKDPFPIGVTAESQYSTIADTNVQGGIAPIIIFRNDVKNLSRENGGKHCGQPLTGYPLNWCELSEYGGDPHVAVALGKGRLGTHLTVVDPTGTASTDEAINDPNFSLFKSFNGQELFTQPRRSFYSGGLALDIEIGGTSAPTAPSMENASWSKLPGKRLI